jgi:hypothetical protein
MERYACVREKASDAAQIARYLPGNYHVIAVDRENVYIGGEDRAGWTLDDYVIPRLASGLYFAGEISEATVPPADNSAGARVLIADAREAFGADCCEGPISPSYSKAESELIGALDAFWGMGSVDSEAGATDTTGHVFRVGRFTLFTDSQGFKHPTEHESETDAEAVVTGIADAQIVFDE